jgi:hypothetical protein
VPASSPAFAGAGSGRNRPRHEAAPDRRTLISWTGLCPKNDQSPTGQAGELKAHRKRRSTRMRKSLPSRKRGEPLGSRPPWCNAPGPPPARRPAISRRSFIAFAPGAGHGKPSFCRFLTDDQGSGVEDLYPPELAEGEPSTFGVGVRDGMAEAVVVWIGMTLDDGEPIAPYPNPSAYWAACGGE